MGQDEDGGPAKKGKGKDTGPAKKGEEKDTGPTEKNKENETHDHNWLLQAGVCVYVRDVSAKSEVCRAVLFDRTSGS